MKVHKIIFLRERKTMAESKSKKLKRPTAEKRVLQNKKRRLINKIFKTKTRTAIRNLEQCLNKGSDSEVQESLNIVYSFMDKGVKRKIFKLGNASRTKSRLAAKVALKAST